MKTYTNEEIIELIEDEGIGYVIMDYLSPAKIEDPKLRELFTKAYLAINEIEVELGL